MYISVDQSIGDYIPAQALFDTMSSHARPAPTQHGGLHFTAKLVSAPVFPWHSPFNIVQHQLDTDTSKRSIPSCSPQYIN